VQIWKTLQNAQNWVVWGGYVSPKVTDIVAIDRVHTTSYSSLIETMRLSSTVFQDIVSYLLKFTDFTLGYHAALFASSYI